MNVNVNISLGLTVTPDSIEFYHGFNRIGIINAFIINYQQEVNEWE
jgi:hypothetical protein